MMKPLFPEISVNGRIIPHDAIMAEAQLHPAPSGKPGHAWQAAARALVLRQAMLDAATASGLVPAPREIGPGLFETEDESLIRQFIEARVCPEPVAEAGLIAAYTLNPARFTSPPLWEVSHILFAAPEGDARQRSAACQRAAQTVARLKDRPALWSEVVEQSVCPSARNGGRLGQIAPGDTDPALESELRRMQPGDIAGPVETRFGAHILRLDAVAEGTPLPFEAVREKLRDAAEKAAWVRASRKVIASIMAAADITGLPQHMPEVA